MNSIETLLDYEIKWRTDEISIIKSIPHLYPLSNQQRKVWEKHTIPIFYSLWEGFIVEALSIYIREINSLKLSINEICIHILVHSIDESFKLGNSRQNFNKKMQLIQNISTYISEPIKIPLTIPTESNVNFKVTNKLLTRFNLAPLSEKQFKKKLDKLLFFRNKLSHGEYDSVKVDKDIIHEMSNTVIYLMHSVTEKISSGYRNKSYLHTKSNSYS